MSLENQTNPINANAINAPAADTQWQRDTIEKLAASALTEQKKSRRWSNFFKALMFIYLFRPIIYCNGLDWWRK